MGFFKKEKIKVEKLEPVKKQMGKNDYYILKKLQFDNGIVNVCSNLNIVIDFDSDGKMSSKMVERTVEHFGIVELEYIPFTAKMLDNLSHPIITHSQGHEIIQSSLNEITSKNWFYSLFTVLLDKFKNEIYVLIYWGYGCYVFDKNRKYQGLYTFYNTGFGYKNCQVSIDRIIDEMQNKQRIKLKDRKKNLQDAQDFYDMPLRRLEGAKASLKQTEINIEEENKNFNDKWGYLT